MKLFGREISSKRIATFYRIHCKRNCQAICRVKSTCNEIIEAFNRSGIVKFIKKNCSCCYNIDFCHRTQEQIKICYSNLYSNLEDLDIKNIEEFNQRERFINEINKF